MNRLEKIKKLIESSERMLLKVENQAEENFEQGILDNLYLLLEKAENNRLIHEQRISAAKFKKKK